MKEFIIPTQNLWNFPEGKVSIGNHTCSVNEVRYYEHATDTREVAARLIVNHINNNVIIAASDTFKVLAVMNSRGIMAISAHLKVVSRDSLKVLITVSDADFVKESFLDLYSLVREIEENSKTDVYATEFTFMNKSSSFNIEQLELDGFRYSFKPLEASRESAKK